MVTRNDYLQNSVTDLAELFRMLRLKKTTDHATVAHINKLAVAAQELAACLSMLCKELDGKKP